jgi:hypothetical protein
MDVRRKAVAREMTSNVGARVSAVPVGCVRRIDDDDIDARSRRKLGQYIVKNPVGLARGVPAEHHVIKLLWPSAFGQKHDGPTGAEDHRLDYATAQQRVLIRAFGADENKIGIARLNRHRAR